MITVFSWVKADVQSAKAVISKYETTANQRSWMMGSSDLGDYSKLQILLSSAGSAVTKNYDSSIIGFDNAWHSVGFTYDDANILYLYIDGVKDPSPTKTTDTAMTSIFDSGVPVMIGCYSAAYAWTGFLTGSIVEGTIYNRVLSESEMKVLYDSTYRELKARGFTI